MWNKFTAKKLKWRRRKDTYYCFIKILNLQKNCLISIFGVFTACEVLSSREKNGFTKEHKRDSFELNVETGDWPVWTYSTGWEIYESWWEMKTSSHCASWKQLLLNIPHYIFMGHEQSSILNQLDILVLDFDSDFGNNIY